MPVDYYPNKNIEQLVAILENLQKRQIEGTLTEVTAVGVRTVKNITPGNSALDIEILRVRYSLYRRAQDAGEAEANKWTNPYKERVKRTRANYI